MEQTNIEERRVRGSADVALARRTELKGMISEKGLTNMPSNSVLSKQFNVSMSQIDKDMRLIISTFDPHELDVFFTDCYNFEKKSLEMCRDLAESGSPDQKLKAIDMYLKVTKASTELLEAYAKKQKVSDKIEIDTRNYVINITDSQDTIIDVTPKTVDAEVVEDDTN